MSPSYPTRTRTVQRHFVPHEREQNLIHRGSSEITSPASEQFYPSEIVLKTKIKKNTYSKIQVFRNYKAHSPPVEHPDGTYIRSTCQPSFHPVSRTIVIHLGVVENWQKTARRKCISPPTKPQARAFGTSVCRRGFYILLHPGAYTCNVCKCK